jgi:hypothetical protein
LIFRLRKSAGFLRIQITRSAEAGKLLEQKLAIINDNARVPASRFSFWAFAFAPTTPKKDNKKTRSHERDTILHVQMQHAEGSAFLSSQRVRV